MTRFTQRRDGLSAIVPTPAPVTKLVMPVTKVRTGRPPLGQVAMTAAERQRRRRAALKSGEAAGRKKEPVAAHPQKSNRAICTTLGTGTEAHGSLCRQNCSSISLWFTRARSANPASIETWRLDAPIAAHGWPRRGRVRPQSRVRRPHARKNPSLPTPRSPIAQSQLRRGWLSRQSHGRLQVYQKLSALPLKQYGTIWVHLRRQSASTASPIPMAGLKSASQTTGRPAITK